MRITKLLALLLPAPLALASCGSAPAGDNSAYAARAADRPAIAPPFVVEEMARFQEPWAIAFQPGTGTLFVTEKQGHIRFRREDGSIGNVTGTPQVDYGGQGGLGDLVFAPPAADDPSALPTAYLSWVEAGSGDTRGAVVGRARLECAPRGDCALRGLAVIWRQVPKVTGRGHFSHRIAISPDGQYLFVASGERQKMTPAQDLTVNLGKVVRLNRDGTPAAGNPFAARAGVSREVWSYGHRNILGLAFAGDGKLWALEHGPRGGDEINLIVSGRNYGWPEVSEGDHYDGRAIHRHVTRPELAAPATSWNPVIAPGGMIVYRGTRFAEWHGNALIAAMDPAAVVRVTFDGESAREEARYPMEHRIRAIAEHPDGSVWIAEDGQGLASSRILRLTPAPLRR